MTVVEYAIGRFSDDNDYDSVFCVFDRDSHSDYEPARLRCRELRRRRSNNQLCQFFAITSAPCFEYWLLLHFVDTDAPIVEQGGKSPGEVAERLLKKHFPEYKKGSLGLFVRLRDHLATAIRRAIRVNARNHENPHTKIVYLLKRLFEIKAVAKDEWAKTILAALKDAE
jgi:hypothetical protein